MQEKLAIGLKDAAMAVGLSPWTLRGLDQAGEAALCAAGPQSDGGAGGVTEAG
jgi:hypothetical protein